MRAKRAPANVALAGGCPELHPPGQPPPPPPPKDRRFLVRSTVRRLVAAQRGSFGLRQGTWRSTSRHQDPRSQSASRIVPRRGPAEARGEGIATEQNAGETSPRQRAQAGRLCNAFETSGWDDVVLLPGQTHVNEDKYAGKTIEEIRAQASRKLGCDIVVNSLARFAVGGI